MTSFHKLSCCLLSCGLSVPLRRPRPLSNPNHTVTARCPVLLSAKAFYSQLPDLSPAKLTGRAVNISDMMLERDSFAVM